MEAAKDLPPLPPSPATANSTDDVQETGRVSYSNGKVSEPVVVGAEEEEDDEGFLSGEEEFVAALENPFVGSLELPPEDVAVDDDNDDDDGETSSKGGVLEGVNGVSEKGSKDGVVVDGEVVEGIVNGVSDDDKLSQDAEAEDKVPEPVEAEDKVPPPVEAEDKVPQPVEAEDKVPQPVEAEDKVPEPVEAEAEVPEPVEAEDKVSQPVGAGDKVPEPIEAEDKVPEPVEDEDKVPEPVEAEDKVPEPVEAEDKVPEHVEAEDKVPESEPADLGVDAKDNGGETVNDEVADSPLELAETAAVASTETNEVKLTPEGDSVVEAIKVSVNVADPGVAAVGDSVAEDGQTEVPGKENVVEESAADDEETEVLGKENGTINDTKGEIVEVDGVKFTSEGDAVVEKIDVDVNVAEPGVVVVGKEAVKDDEQAKVEDLNIADANDEIGEEEEKPAELEGVDVVGSIAGKDREIELPGADDASNEGVDQKDIEVEPEAETEQSSSNGYKDDMTSLPEPAAAKSVQDADEVKEGDEDQTQVEEQVDRDLDDSNSDGENDEMIFGSSEAAKQFIEELERGESHNHSQRIDGQIVTDSEDEEGDSDEEGKQMFDSAALAALLKAATGADSDGGGNITITSQDGSRLFSVERPAGLGSSLRALRPTPQQRRPTIFPPSVLSQGASLVPESNLTDEEKKKLEKLQAIRVKFLRLVHRLGVSPDESIAAQVLHRLSIVAGRQNNHIFDFDAAKMMAMELEAEKRDTLDFSLNILVIGKCGVGKSATINSIFGEEKAQIDAFQAGTKAVKEIIGDVDGVKIRVYDTPGLKTSAMEQSFNKSVLSKVNRITKKNPPDIILYVDRLDAQTRDLNDLPMLKTITESLGTAIWRNAIVTLTHASSAPPEGPTGNPLSYEVFVTQRSHVVQQTIGQGVGDLRMMTPSMMNPVSLAENHPLCRRNREGQKVLPNGQSWKPQLLLLCYSMKILSEASSLSKPQDPFDHKRLFGFRSRAPPLPYMLSSMLQSRDHPKLPSDQGMDSLDSDIDLDDLSDLENDEEDEYDQLPPFKPLRKTQIAKLSKEQKKAYFEEYDYRVKLLQKKQVKEELKRIKKMKSGNHVSEIEYGMGEDEADAAAAAPVAVPLPDMVLPPSFDAESPGYRYRFLEPTSQFLARPVLDTHGWDHDCGYDGVNVEQSLALANRFPANITVQVTKDKKDFSINVDSSISKKHGEAGSSMVGFDVVNMGKQLAYVFRGETKSKVLKRNKATAGVALTLFGENTIPGLKFEDQITLNKQYLLVGSAGIVSSQNDTAMGANFELQRRENDFPIGQVQSTLSMSLVRWRGDNALGFNGLTQINLGRNSKVAVRAGINNKMSGQLSVRTSSSDQFSLALMAIVPAAINMYKKLVPNAANDQYMY